MRTEWQDCGPVGMEGGASLWGRRKDLAENTDLQRRNWCAIKGKRVFRKRKHGVLRNVRRIRAAAVG